MATFIISHQGWYFEWSSHTDSPSTFGMRKDEFEAYYLEQYGKSGMRDLPSRLARADATGTSARDCNSATELVAINGAGFEGSQLTLAEIIQIYCVERRMPREGEGEQIDWDE